MSDGTEMDLPEPEGDEAPVYTAPAVEPPPNSEAQPSRGEPGSNGGAIG